MPENWRNRLTDQLADALLSLKTKDEMYNFLEDVATISEIKDLSQRLEVVRQIEEGASYPQIVQSTGASTATVSRGRKSLDSGRNGFKLVIDRLKIKENSVR